MKRTKLLLAALLLSSTLLLITSQTVRAFSLNDVVDNVKTFLNQQDDKNVKSKAFTIKSDIVLATGGDEKKNNEIDAGDVVRFTYTLINTTGQNYSFGTLKTNIDSRQISSVHNIHGATGIINDEKTIEIPYVRLNPGQTLIISFDALIKYFQEDKIITTEAEFIDTDKKSIAKSERSETVAKKLSVQEVEERGISLKKQ